MNIECFYGTENMEINFQKASESETLSVAMLFFDATLDTVGFQGCKCTVPSHADLLFCQHSQVILSATLNPFSILPILMMVIFLTQVQDSVLGLLERYEVCTGPSLKPVLTPQQSSVSSRSSDRLKDRCDLVI